MLSLTFSEITPTKLTLKEVENLYDEACEVFESDSHSDEIASVLHEGIFAIAAAYKALEKELAELKAPTAQAIIGKPEVSEDGQTIKLTRFWRNEPYHCVCKHDQADHHVGAYYCREEDCKCNHFFPQEAADILAKEIQKPL